MSLVQAIRRRLGGGGWIPPKGSCSSGALDPLGRHTVLCKEGWRCGYLTQRTMMHGSVIRLICAHKSWNGFHPDTRSRPADVLVRDWIGRKKLLQAQVQWLVIETYGNWGK